MIRTTPFYPRLSELNQTGLYGHWAGHLSTLRYDLSAKHEYFAVRNSAGFFDTSPLYKYRITGPDAERFLAGVMTRDVRTCRPGQAMYTVWCDDDGYVLEDGVLFRHAEDDWLLTAADPNLGYLDCLIGRLRVSIEDVSADYGVLAVQGPRSREILARLAPEVDDLALLRAHPRQDRRRAGHHLAHRLHRRPRLRGVRRVRRRPRRARPDHAGRRGPRSAAFGEDALLMLRIEAGLALINVEFSSARLRLTPTPSGSPPRSSASAGCSARAVPRSARTGPFVGRRAIERELADGTSRWATVGLWVDWRGARAAPRRARPGRAQGREPARLGVDAVRRATRPLATGTRRLRDQPHVLPGAPAPHRAWHVSRPSTPRRARRCTWRSPSTTSTSRCRRPSTGCRCSTPPARPASSVELVPISTELKQ